MTLYFDMLTDKEIFGYTLDIHYLMDDMPYSHDGKTKEVKPLNIFKEYGTKVEVTDLALLLGGNDPKFSSKQVSTIPITWCGYPYTAYNPWRGYARTEAETIGSNGKKMGTRDARWRDLSVRPAVFTNYYAIDNCHSSLWLWFRREDVLNIGDFPGDGEHYYDVSSVTSGEYPQMVADKKTSAELENLYNAKKLSTTGKTYTLDTADVRDRNAKTKLETLQEYLYRDKKYIRVIARPSGSDRKFANGEVIKEGQPYWVEVQPIEWYRDFPSGVLLAKKCLFAGLPLAAGKAKDQLTIQKYMDTYFAREASLSEWEKLSEYQQKLEKIVAKKKEDREVRGAMAEKLKEARRKKTTFLDRLLGASGRKKAVKAAEKFHKKNPEQKTALKFKSSKKSEHE